MFRLHKTRPAPGSNKSGEKIDFKFSNFKLVQVPKGWDRLFTSIMSMENGKTMAKTSKALVRNGSCHWTETLSESTWVSKTEKMGDCLFKLVVAMGSARSSILGEATVNMTGYINSTVVVPVSLPLKKCNHGTVLQLKIQCLTPRPKPMDNETEQTNSKEEGNNTKHPPDLSLSSDGTESSTAKAADSSLTPDFVSAPLQEELVSREASFSASDSFLSYDSAESSIGRESSSSVSNLNGDSMSLMEKQVAPTSQNGLNNGNSHVDDLSHSDHSSFVSQSSSSDTWRANDSAKNLLEAAEKTIEELHAEAKMWKKNADKLMLDLDILWKQYSDQSKTQANLTTELSAANAERDGLRKEVEHLKTLLEKSMVKQTTSGDSTFQDDGITLLQKELENEIKFQKETNDSLTLQLKRSQEANVELVSVLQELEETIEKQKVEMENISSLRSHVSELENTMQQNSEENRNLMIQLQQSRESEMNLQAEAHRVEQALKDKENSDALEEEYKNMLAAKERELVGLKVKLSESRKERHFSNPELRKGGDVHLIREIEALRAKLEELETDCNELTDENLELLLKIKETNGGVAGSEQKSEMLLLEEKLRKKILREIQSDYNSYIQELETQRIELEAEVTDLVNELAQKRTDIQTLETTIQSKEEEIMELRLNQSKLEDKCKYLRREITELQATNETLIEECNSIKQSAEDLRKDKSELEEHCAHLEGKLRECSKKIEVFDGNLTLVMKDFASEEERLTLGLDEIYDKTMKLEAKLKLEESSCSRTDEVENLRQEVESFAKQLSAAHHEKEKTAYDALCEISGLQEDKVKLESALEEAKSKLRLTENEFKKTETEAKSEVDDLLSELAASRENREALMVEHEKALKLLECYKSSEGKLKTIVNDLELKLIVSEYEQQKVSEQSSNMKVQQLKIENLEDDILALRDELVSIEAVKGELETSLHLLSRECDDLKAERNYFMQQISTLQKVVSELDVYKHEKVALEEKLVQMEGDLATKEPLLKNVEIKNELNEIKQTNRQLQQQIKQLQEEKDELLIKPETLEDKLKLKVEEKQTQRHSGYHRNRREDSHYDSNDGSNESELTKATESNNKYKARVTRLSEGRRSQSNTSRKSTVETEVVAKEKYERTKTSLEAELSDIRERYLQMSLKYAEVEAQREELVMKLRGVKSIRRWFSSNPPN
ncbi:F-box and Leucine Rich Repeat domains containing protein, putative isoform 2 [Hibiscus syriacus]|uniref:F-box and Leucine Rich Repeat domains containing protein, putative isoform 2 n=1 Tax=Hibiscus syriacus TaxID=106335 RepID=A0A6A2WXC2_HIBSY|nr:myosin-11-like [Hibiscus syriacus]KAE8666268.1 F-box and Leucine Rich Repeat domains containing protein, putative isoform 2 [Hibiscus syriacus]